MIVAGRASVFAATVLFPVFILGAVNPPLLWMAIAGDLMIVLMIYIQGRALKGHRVEVSREGWEYLYINRKETLVYRVENKGRRRMLVAIRQMFPNAILADGKEPLNVIVEPGEAVKVGLDVVSRHRGLVKVPPPVIDIKSPSVEWAGWRFGLKEPARLVVFPDTRSLEEYDVLRRNRALGLFGVHRMRQIGAGQEFEQLREYTRDDEYRNVNWKATAKRQTPITNVYQSEKSQNVMLCIECGRMMGSPLDKGIILDRAIDAGIMLAHVANRNSDKVGLAVFKDTVDLFIKPKRGVSATNHIVEKLVHLEPEGVFPSYGALVDTLRSQNKARSLVFVFTDVSDPKLADDLCKTLPMISRRHLVVVVSLLDPTLATIARGGAESMNGVYNVLAARKLMSERESRLGDLRKRGVQVLEAESGALSLAVINRYLEIKKRQLL